MSLKATSIIKYSLAFFKCALAIILLSSLQACPYTSVYCIDTNPQNQINESYLGRWQGEWIDPLGNKKKVRLDITRIDDYHYEWVFHGNFYKHPKAKKCLLSFRKKKKRNEPAEDTIRYCSYASFVNERELINISSQGKQYFAELIYKDDRLSILPIDESFTSKIILSDEELREALQFHYKSRLNPAYDETICLRDMIRVAGN